MNATSSGGSYFWPGKVKTFFSLTLVRVLVVVFPFEELDVVIDFTFTIKNSNGITSLPDMQSTNQ